MAAELSFLALKTVAAFQDVRQVAQSQAVCKNWCWGMREQTASITTATICSEPQTGFTQALQSGSCCPDRLILDVVGRPEEVPEEAVEKLAEFVEKLKCHRWFRKLNVVQEKVNGGRCSGVYTRKSGYSSDWHLENVVPLVEATLLRVPEQLQELAVECQMLPTPRALLALGTCTQLHTLHIDCHQGTLTAPDAAYLVTLAASLKDLSLILPELHKSAVEALVAGLTGLEKLRLERKTSSVCASPLAGLAGLKGLVQLQLVGYGPLAMADLKEMAGLSCLELSHACMGYKEDWEAVVALTALKELHLIPVASALMTHPPVVCPLPLHLPHLSSLKMLVPCDPHALASFTAASVLHALHLHLSKQQDGSAVCLTPLAHLHNLRSVTLSGPTLALGESMLHALCAVAQHVTHLAVLGRIGPLGPEGLAPMRAAMPGLKHLALGAHHMDQMFVVEVAKELPHNLEVLELRSACLVHEDGIPPVNNIVEASEDTMQVGQEAGYRNRGGRNAYQEKAKGRGSRVGKLSVDHRGALSKMQSPGVVDACHVDKIAAYSLAGVSAGGSSQASNGAGVTAEVGAGGGWAASLRSLHLHKCCGVPAGSTTPDSTMLQPVLLHLGCATNLGTVALTDCTLADVSVQGALAGGAVATLTLAPYENWRGTAAQLTAQGMQAVLWAPAAAAVRKLEVRLTHRMHRDGTDAVLMSKVLPGISQLRVLRVYTEESNWHRLPPTKALGGLRALQHLHVGAVHERKIPAFIAGLQQVLPPGCRLTVIKYSPDLLEG